MIADNLFVFLALLGIALLVSAISGIICRIAAIKTRNKTYGANLKIVYFSAWLIVTESALVYFLFEPLSAFLIWCALMTITFFLSVRRIKSKYITGEIKAKRGHRRMDEKEIKLREREEFILYAERKLAKTIFFSFGLLFISWMVCLIPFFERADKYGMLLGYLRNVLTVISASTVVCSILSFFIKHGVHEDSWKEDKSYRIIWYCAYIGFTAAALVIMSLGYFGVWK